MADRSLEKKSVVFQKKRPVSTSKAEKSKKVEFRQRAKSASCPAKTLTDDLLAKEEQYKLLNAEIEAKTADLVRQTEQLMREQNEALSKPNSNFLLTDNEDDNSLRFSKPQLEPAGLKVVTKKRTPASLQNKQQRKELHNETTASKESHLNEPAQDSFLAKAIQSMEEKMGEAVAPENIVDELCDAGDAVGPGIADAQIRVLKAKLRIMQEEVDHLSCEYYKKEDENMKLCAKVKELEEDRARLLKSSNIQQTQIEKHRASAEESARKSDGLQLEVSGLRKEIENLNRSHRQAAAVHSTVEVRLNRALEEVERLKAQLHKIRLTNKEKISEEHQGRENLEAENKMLKKQKGELIVGFKKQLKLIDILKRQKMHLEAAKLLSFTEEEFLRALDWGKS
ncbi:testis-expressed protein 9 [Salarias fasciatus]|uniref:testis-expressed protein 9 n=1 Tax=Salarias fasciatus TaxID=181472 RepID=UPI001176BAC6|nr:testis-expressed protein 9 [Salarias fasciatus]